MMSYVSFAKLQPSDNTKIIRARVCRVWKHRKQSTNENYASFDAVLVDAQGDAIHESMNQYYIDHFSAALQVGKVYDVIGYYANPNKTINAIVPQTCMLRFTRKSTQIRDATGDTSQIPMHRFYFLDYALFYTKRNNYKVLTDYICHLKTVHSLRPIHCFDGRQEDKRDLIVENLRKEEMKISLWGEVARLFDEQAVRDIDTATIMVITSTKINYFRTYGLNSTPATVIFFNPDIPETSQFLAVFTGHDTKAVVRDDPLNASMSIQQVMSQNKTTLRDLHIDTKFDMVN